VIQFTWAIPNYIHAFVKHKEFLNYILVGPFLSNHFTLPSKLSKPYLASHKPPAISFLPSSHKKVKMINQPFPIVWIACFVVLDWCVYVVLFYVIAWYGEQRVLLREVKDRKLIRQVTHILLPILLLH
jgi:hypothetical protein